MIECRTIFKLRGQIRWAVVFLLSTLLMSKAGFTQLTTATLMGTITDGTGAVVGGVTVEAVNDATHFTAKAVSSGTGYYRMDLLPIGTYTLTVEASGFKKFVQANVTLSVNQQANVDVALELGAMSETVTVTTEPPQINLENAAVGRTIETAEVVALPLVDRNAYSFLDLVPGVQSNSSGNTLGYPQQVVQINGSTVESNTGSVSYYLDGGLDMTSLRMTGNQMPNPEALAQFNVQTSNYNASYGRMSSGVVSAITKSGTNQFHGTVYEFHRETNFNSTPWATYGSSRSRAPVHRNFFGGVVGGPIKRDRTFFFFDYAGYKDVSNKQFTGGAVLPTAKEAKGDFSEFLPGSTISSCNQTLSTADKAAGKFIVCNPTTRKPYAGNIITDTLDPVAVNILKSLQTSNGGSTLLPSYSGSLSLPNHYNEYMGKLDHQLTENQRLAGSYFYLKGQNTVFPGSGNMPWGLQTQDYLLHVLNMSDTITISSNKVNQVWATYTRSFGTRANGPRKTLTDFGSAFLAQGTASLPNITVTNYFSLTNAIEGPNAGTNFYSVRDLYIWTLNKHTLQIGAEASLNKDALPTYLNNYGTWGFQSSTSARTGNALADYMLGLANSQAQDAPVVASSNAFFYSLFAQDDWRVTPRFTVNAGLRWDLQMPPTDPQDKASTFVVGKQSSINPNAPIGQLFPGDSGVSRGIVQTPYLHISPRLGFAWDVFGNGKTSLRGGAGIFWGGVSGNEWNTPSNFYPFTLRYTFGVPGTLAKPYLNTASPFPFNYTAGKVTTAPSGTSLSGIGLNFRWPFTYQISASVEQQITPSFAITIGYVGSLARALPFSPDMNYPVFNAASPTSNTTKNVNNRRPNSALGTIVELGDTATGIARATSNYNSMQFTFTKRMGHGVSVKGHYIWSKTLSSAGLDSSNVTVEDVNNMQLEKGPSNNDLRHQLVTTVVWQPNFFKQNRYLDAVFDGWSISPIITIKSGTPFSVTTGTDSNMDGVTSDRANKIGNPYDSTVNHASLAKNVWFNPAAFCGYDVNNPTTCQGTGPGGSDGTTERNGFYGPAYRNVNMALLRNFTLRHGMAFQLRGEATNVFNMVNFNPASSISITTATSQITSAYGMRTIQIGARLSF